MDILRKHFQIIGLKVRDKVTGFEGVVTTVSFDLYGCVQVVVSPPVKDGDLKDGRWFDIQRLEILDTTPVMAIPSFEALATPTPERVHTRGPAEKPVR